MAMNIKLIASLTASLAIAACTPVDAGFGDSVRTNLAVQTIDPEPVHNGAEPDYSGQKGAAAVERYRTDKVKPPKGIRTTNTIGGGSNGASGGTAR